MTSSRPALDEVRPSRAYMPLVWRVTAVAAVVIVLLGGTVAAVVLSVRAITCVTGSFGNRAKPALTYLHAEHRFASKLAGFEAVVFDPTQPAARQRRAARQMLTRTTAWRDSLAKDITAIAANPIGRC